jgi:hypothetical protein
VADKMIYQIDLVTKTAFTSITSYGDLPVESRTCALIDTSKFVNPTYYFEMVGNNQSAVNNLYASLYDQGTYDECDESGSLVSGSEVSVYGTTYQRDRSSAITLTSGNRYRVQYKVSGNVGNLHSARIIVVDDISGAWDDGEIQIELGEYKSSATTTWSPTGMIWKYESDKYDGTVAIYYEGYIYADTSKAGELRLMESANADMSSSSVVTNSLISSNHRDFPQRVRSSALTLTNGNYHRGEFHASSATKTAWCSGSRIILQQTGTITKSRVHRNNFRRWSASSGAYDRSDCQCVHNTGNMPGTINDISFWAHIRPSTGTAYADLYDIDAPGVVSGSEVSNTSEELEQASGLSLVSGNEIDSRGKTGGSGTTTIYGTYVTLDAALSAPPPSDQQQLMLMGVGI